MNSLFEVFSVIMGAITIIFNKDSNTMLYAVAWFAVAALFGIASGVIQIANEIRRKR